MALHNQCPIYGIGKTGSRADLGTSIFEQNSTFILCEPAKELVYCYGSLNESSLSFVQLRERLLAAPSSFSTSSSSVRKSEYSSIVRSWEFASSPVSVKSG